MRISFRNRLLSLIEQGNVPKENIKKALLLLEITPTGKSWRTFIDQMILWLGGLALSFALLFFIAYNWTDIWRFAKFALVEVVMILAIVFYSVKRSHGFAGKLSLFAATLFLGILLALFGQTYQTGADPWQLFFNWALLMLPWAIIGRFAALWIIWVALINLSILLYHNAIWGSVWSIFRLDDYMQWILIGFNFVSLVVWETLQSRSTWMLKRWAPRILVLGSCLPLTWLSLITIIDHSEGNLISPPLLGIWLAMAYTYYHRIQHDLFMLACGCLSTITVVITFLAMLILEDLDAGGFLILALAVIGMGSGAAIWLKRVNREWQL